MNEPGTLMKFGQLDHLVQLQNEGLLYMNNLPYFWNLENDELRGDPFDSIAAVYRGPRISFPSSGGKEIFLEGKWTIRMHPPESDKINRFCMYALRPLIQGTFPIDHRNFRFGDHVLILMNRDEFMRRIELTLQTEKIEAKGNLVEYVDDEYVGEVGPFKKHKMFSYQSEWRLVCKNGPGGLRLLRIGSIKDISEIIRSDVVNKEIQIHFEQPTSSNA